MDFLWHELEPWGRDGSLEPPHVRCPIQLRCWRTLDVTLIPLPGWLPAWVVSGRLGEEMEAVRVEDHLLHSPTEGSRASRGCSIGSSVSLLGPEVPWLSWAEGSRRAQGQDRPQLTLAGVGRLRQRSAQVCPPSTGHPQLCTHSVP